MCRLISALIIAIVIIKCHHSTGYKWINVRSEDPIPDNAVQILHEPSYVGRARHFDELLLAKVHNSSYATVSSCSETISKLQFEVLVATEQCDWEYKSGITNIPINIVRAGSAKNGEPSYVATRNNELKSIYSSRLRTDKTNGWYILTCIDSNVWIDTISTQIPQNAISGGKSNDGEDIFVARLKENCEIIPGQVIPELGVATATWKKFKLQSLYCQVLTGDILKFEWIEVNDRIIPDYAVVGGTTTQNFNELLYVARVNKTIGYVVHSQILRDNINFDVLTKRQDEGVFVVY